MRILTLLAVAGFFALPAFAQAQTRAAELPEPAIPGLRYYYPPEKVEPRTVECDVCIYGGTSGGVAAAIQAARMGEKTLLLEFGKHVGGLTTGGLSHTDGGGDSVCGGIAREFYNQAGQANFKPSVAEKIYLDMLQDAGVEVRFLSHLDKVQKDGTRIVSITMEDGLTVKADQFIDGTYEGDLMARAGVSFHVGREANSVYDETWNGIRKLGTGGHDFARPVDPYVEPGNPGSGLLPRIVEDPGVPGEGDESIQAYCFRMRLVKDADRMPFPKPAVYDLAQYEIMARLFETGADPQPRWSIDTNNHHLWKGAYFIDFVGGNYGWPEGDWKTREQIFQDHANYQIGVMHFLTTSERIPEQWRNHFREFGLPRDEYQDTSGWTHQLYIREGRRMVSDYVMTQHNCEGREVPEDSIGIASYNMDSHHCQMGVLDGAVRKEGNVEVGVNPYPVAYRSITPKQNECTNLLVPLALSSSHIAYGSIRMEPVFMILGQSAATAASLAKKAGVSVQDVDYAALKERLLADKQILEYTGPKRINRSNIVDAASLPGVVIDNEQAKISEGWEHAGVVGPRVGESYLHDGNAKKGELTARFEAKLPRAGRYEVRLAWPVNPNRATNVPVTVVSAGGEKSITVNQRERPPIDGLFLSLGTYDFEATGAVEITNRDTNGYVLVDAVQFIPVE